MPPGAAKWWFKDWYKDSFLEGHRKIRGDIVFHIARNHNLIFGIVNTQFRDKKLRVMLPEVQELRKTFQYQYLEPGDPKPADPGSGDDEPADTEDGNPKPKPDPTTLFRHDCIMKAKSAIASGVRSKKARNAHSGLWHIKEVTPAVIAFAVTAIDYVLSGEGSFEKSAPESDYFEFFRGRLTMLTKLHQKHIATFHDLINYLNRSVLPDEYPPGEGAEVVGDPLPRGLSQRDIDFMEGW
ncbi:hypothetical protein FRC10_007101 [Ceratobasidium sp. 414]|nr:hypothetical protein FRC10_007101 [Ceratobasidium sp. 414]